MQLSDLLSYATLGFVADATHGPLLVEKRLSKTAL
jgi:hypothetical protein